MPDVIDPSGFQISVVVRSGGNSFPLWIGGATNKFSTIFYGEDSDDVLYEDLPIVESVQVDIGMGLIGKVSVEIATTYNLGLKLLESAIFAIGSTIEVQIGYPRIGKFMPWFSTMATKPSINLNPDDGLTASLNGEGGAFAASRGGSSETFSGTYESIIRRISKMESNKWTVDIPVKSGANDPLYIERENVSQGNRTDWMFVQYLCRVANYDSWIMADPSKPGANLLKLRRRSEVMSGTPRYTFVARGRCDFINSFPILSFESSAEGVWLPPREQRSADIDIMTRETPPETIVRPEDTGTAVLPGDTTPGAGSTDSDGMVIATEPQPRDARGTGRRVVHPAHSPETSSEVLTSMATEGRQHGGLNASFSTIGLPHIFPGEAVKLVGLGIFSGNYVIESISHSAAPGEWTMTIKLLGDGVDARGMETAISQVWDKYNTEEAEQQQESEGGGAITVEPESAD